MPCGLSRARDFPDRTRVTAVNLEGTGGFLKYRNVVIKKTFA